MKRFEGSLSLITGSKGVTRTRRGFLAAACLAALLLAAPAAHAALDMFMEAGKEIQGETKDKEFGTKGAMDVLAWSWGMSNSGSTHVGGGAGAGKASFQDLSFTKYLDKATTALMTSLAKGTHIPEVKLTMRRAGETQTKYLVITMRKVIVTSLSTGGSGGEDRLTENVTLNFAEVSVEYFPLDDKGGTGATGQKFGWNIAENVAK